MTQRYDAVAVRRYTDGQGNEKTAYTTVGVAFPMRERDGFTVRLNAIPAPTEGEYVILLMPPKARDDQRQASSQSGIPGRGAGSLSRDLDDDIPFAPEFR